jgi:hypothetical protein
MIMILIIHKSKYYIIAAIAVLTACTERIDINLDNSYTRLVVEGGITTDTTAHEVRLSRSASYFSDKQLEPVIGAHVIITDSIHQYLLKEEYGRAGMYATDTNVYGIPRHTYTLNISNVDINKDGHLEEYTASSFLPPLRHPDSIQVEYVNRFFHNIWEVRFYGQDPPETRDFYMFKAWRNRKLITDTLRKVGLSSDEYYNGSYIHGEPVAYFREGRPAEKLNDGDTITLETLAITEKYYNFIIDVFIESQGSDPFGGQPANISTNISNNGVGFFYAYSVARNHAIWRKKSVH